MSLDPQEASEPPTDTRTLLADVERELHEYVARTGNVDPAGSPLFVFVRELRRRHDTLEAALNAVAIKELVGICQWIEKTFDMGADRSQVADPAIIARRDIYAGILARIVELKEGA